MRVLVTGSQGSIGRYVTRALLDAGYEVLGLGRRPRRQEEPFAYFPADISRQEALEAIAGQIGALDAVVHCAAHISYDDADSRLMLVNAAGTQNVVTLAKRCGAGKVVYLSSIPVIGVPVLLPIAEDHPLAPKTMYHVSKLAGEYIVKASGLGHTILRIASPVGPGMSPKTILPTFLSRCLAQEPLSLHGTGGRIQNYISMLDVARAVVLSLDGADGCYHLAGDSISNRDLAELCKRATRSRSQIVLSGVPDPEDRCRWEVSGEKARIQLGFVPQVGIERTIRSMLRANGEGEGNG